MEQNLLPTGTLEKPAALLIDYKLSALYLAANLSPPREDAEDGI